MDKEQDLLDGLTKDEWGKRIKWRQDEDYVFVSYASLDWKKVYPTVVDMQNKGFNIYIDTEFKEEANIGWIEKMNTYMSDGLCKGILSFVSINSLRSYAVLMEQLFSYSDQVTLNFRDKKIPNFYIGLNSGTPQAIEDEIFDEQSNSSKMKVKMQTNECQEIKKYMTDYFRKINRHDEDVDRKISIMKNKHYIAVEMFDMFIKNASISEFISPVKCSDFLENNFINQKNKSINLKPNVNFIKNTSINSESEIKTSPGCDEEKEIEKKDKVSPVISYSSIPNINNCSSRIGHVLRVLIKMNQLEKPIENYSKAFNNAAVEVASELGVTKSTVVDKCNRQMQLTAEGFNNLVQKWFETKSLDLKNHMLNHISNKIEDKKAINFFFEV